jgi:hypothetical protein
MTILRRHGLAMLALFFIHSNALAQVQGENPFIGTWDIDLERSNFGSAAAPATMARTYYDHEDGTYSYILVTTDQNGVINASSAHYSYSGEAHPIANFNQDIKATISYKRLNETTVEYTVYVNGEVAQIGAKFISPNYQQLTIAIQTPNSGAADQILVFNRRSS